MASAMADKDAETDGANASTWSAMIAARRSHASQMREAIQARRNGKSSGDLPLQDVLEEALQARHDRAKRMSQDERTHGVARRHTEEIDRQQRGHVR